MSAHKLAGRPSGDSPRSVLVTRALRLEYGTVGWNVVEGVIAVSAAALAGSVALLGFGIDSFVESASGGVLIWRLLAERRASNPAALEQVEKRALRLVAGSLIALALYILFDASTALIQRHRPDPSTTGIVLTTVSLSVMWWLAKVKRSVAAALGSRAMQADAFQTTACWWLSLIVLGGVGMNALFGWWWADPAAAIVMTFFILREAKEAWRGDPCCDV